MTHRHAWLFAIPLLALGCDDRTPDPIPSDSGTPPRMDSGTGGGVDAGPPDAGRDAGTTSGTDSGAPTDSGPPIAPGTCPDMDLGSAEGDAVASGVTTGLGNNITPGCVTSSNTDDATFTWTAPRSGDFIFDTGGSEFDTVIVILEGSDCSGTEVGCNDDRSLDLQSRELVTVTEGTTYLVAVDGYSEAKGPYVLNINEGTETEADLCGDSIDNDRDGRVDCDDFDCSSADECSESGDVECADEIDNDDDGNIDCDDSQCFAAAPCIEDGAECSDDLDNDGDEAADCADSDCAADPACIEDGAECSDDLDNDEDGATDCDDPDCARVAACDTCPDQDLGSAVGASVATGMVSVYDRRDPASVGSGECVFSVSGGRDQTFQWVAPSTGMFQIDTNGSTYDTVVYVLDGSCTGSELACDDDGGDGLQSQLTLSATSGQTYIIVLDTYGGFTTSGDFVLNITAL